VVALSEPTYSKVTSETTVHRPYHLVCPIGVHLVVGRELVSNEFAGAVGVQVVGHVVSLRLHVCAHLVEGRCRDKLAVPVHLPGDWSVARANRVGPFVPGCGARVKGKVCAVIAVDNHATHQVRVVVIFVVHNHKRLGLDPNGFVRGWGQIPRVAEDTVVEGSLILVDCSAGSTLGVWPEKFWVKLALNGHFPMYFVCDVDLEGAMADHRSDKVYA
jgi:hypothetical protein